MRKAIDLCIFLGRLVQIVEYVVWDVPRHQPLDCLQASTHSGAVQHSGANSVSGVQVTPAGNERLQYSDVFSQVKRSCLCLHDEVFKKILKYYP